MNRLDQLCIQILEGLDNEQLKQIPEYQLGSGDCEENNMDFVEEFCNREILEWKQHKAVNNSLRNIKRQAQLISLLGQIAELLRENTKMQLRDVFYLFKPLFKSQEESNKLILDLGKTLRMRRFEMNIVPAAKGLIKGPMKIRFQNPSMAYDANLPWIDLGDSSFCDGIHVDWRWTVHVHVEVDIINPEVRFIVIVEKEGVFHQLLEQNFLQKFPCILITSCGYPDVATRALVSKLANLFPILTVVGLCDYNPHGVALLLCFKLKCKATTLEASGFQTTIKWLGLRSNQIKSFCTLKEEFNLSAQKLTENDGRKLNALLNTDFVKSDPNYLNELETMSKGGLKFEIESLYSFGINFIGDFLYSVLLNEDYI